jgi:S-DNA-T family DNA segregation ATPase FtsK/SpoIIIE
VELLLTVEYLAGTSAAADVAVEVDAGAPVSALVAALVGHGRRRGLELPDVVEAVVGGERSRRLDPDRSVVEVGLVSGEIVRLVAPEQAHRHLDEALEQVGAVALDLTSGPEAGRTVVLRPGRYRVGRDEAVDLTVADPTMSREHFTLDVTDHLEVVVHPNPEALNGTFVGDGSITASRSLGHEEVVFAGSTQLVLRSAPPTAPPVRDRLGQVAFNRLPYKRPIVRDRAVPEIAAPPPRPGRRRFPLISMIIPIVGAAAIVALTGRIEFALIAGLSPLMLVSNWLSEGRNSRRSYATESAEFRQRVDRAVEELAELQQAERAERLTAAPDVPLLHRVVRSRSSRLWERTRTSEDFLELRVGVGPRTSASTARVATGGDPDLREPAEARLGELAVLPLVPVTLDLLDTPVAALTGEPELATGMARALLCQAAALHSPEDLVVAAAVGDDARASWEWLKWLPHSRSATSPLEGPHLVVPGGTDELLVRLGEVVRGRLEQASRSSASSLSPRVLLVVDEASFPDRALTSALLDVAGASGVHVLWLARDPAEVPRQARAIAHLVPPVEGSSSLTWTDPERDDQPFDAEPVPVSLATSVARALAPVRDVSAASATTGIPRVVPLFDALGIVAPTGAQIEVRWSRDRPYSLAATLGTGPAGPIEIDLVRDGPHTLIAGTSGAGKSELLQTLVLALAADHPPERLSFLFVDYKGGAASADFADLPHTVGSVTNLDPRLSLRALASLRAELGRRMAILEGRAKDLAEMLRVAPEEAPPSLVIVIDEFATLVKEVPDFVAGVVDIAQRGRSLGIHLVLATQRPAGVVNDNILANTNLRIALRVLDAADSTQVIGSKDAALIPVPLRGRAYARTGPGALTPFQCAWSGAPFRPELLEQPIQVQPFVLGGATGTTAGDDDAPGLGAGGPEGPTQLDVLVEACQAAASARRTPPPRRPWVEPLSEVIPLADAAGDAERDRHDPGRRVVIGVADAPDDQAQFPATVDLEASGGLLVYGAGGSGKTTLLRTVAADLAGQGTPEEVRLFGLDFAGRSLVQLGALPHTVAVATGDDLELVTRVLTTLRGELERRRRLLADAHAESLSAYRRRRGPGDERLPRLVVLLDGYAGFHASFESGPLYTWLAAFQRLVADGRQVGIHVVMTHGRALGIPAALTSAMGARLVLRLSTADEMIGLGVARAAASGAELPPGRGFLGARTEVQVAVAGASDEGAAQAAALAELGQHLDEAGVAPAPPLRALPGSVVLPEETAFPEGPLHVPLGLADLTLEPVGLDLRRANAIVVGPPLSGRSTALAQVAVGLRTALDRQGGDGPLLVGLGALTSPLADAVAWDAAGFGRSAQADALHKASELVSGYEGDDVRVVLFLDAAEDVESIEHNPKLDALLRSDAVRVVAVMEAATLSRAFSGWLGDLKRNRSVLVLQPGGEGDVEAVAGVKPGLRPGQDLPPGRGVLVTRGRASLVQVATPSGMNGTGGGG